MRNVVNNLRNNLIYQKDCQIFKQKKNIRFKIKNIRK